MCACLPACNGTRTLMAVTRALDGAGIEPDDLAVHRPTLDDVFLSLTDDHVSGRGPEAEASEARGRRGRKARR